MVIAFTFTSFPAYWEKYWSLPAVVGASLAVTAVLGLAAYFVFDLGEVGHIVAGRIRRRREVRA